MQQRSAQLMQSEMRRYEQYTLHWSARCSETVLIGGRIVDLSRLFVRPSARMSNQSFNQSVSQLISQNTG